MMKFKLYWSNLLIILLISVPYGVFAAEENIPSTGFCLDEKCARPISEGQSALNYKTTLKDYGLSAKAGVKIVLFSRNDDKKKHALVEIQGKRGFFPPKLVRIHKQNVLTDEVNVPVKFIQANGTIIIEPILDQSHSASGETSSSTSATDENVNDTSPYNVSSKTLKAPDVSSNNNVNKGWQLLPSVSASEVHDKREAGYSPGHSPTDSDSGSSKATEDLVSTSTNANSSSKDVSNNEPVNNLPQDESNINLEKVDTEKDESIAEMPPEDDDGDDDEEDEDGVEIESEDDEMNELRTEKASQVSENVPINPTQPFHPVDPTMSVSSLPSDTPVKTDTLSSSIVPPVSTSAPPVLNMNSQAAPASNNTTTDTSDNKDVNASLPETNHESVRETATNDDTSQGTADAGSNAPNGTDAMVENKPAESETGIEQAPDNSSKTSNPPDSTDAGEVPPESKQEDLVETNSTHGSLSVAVQEPEELSTGNSGNSTQEPIETTPEESTGLPILSQAANVNVQGALNDEMNSSVTSTIENVGAGLPNDNSNSTSESNEAPETKDPAGNEIDDPSSEKSENGHVDSGEVKVDPNMFGFYHGGLASGSRYGGQPHAHEHGATPQPTVEQPRANIGEQMDTPQQINEQLATLTSTAQPPTEGQLDSQQPPPQINHDQQGPPSTIAPIDAIPDTQPLGHEQDIVSQQYTQNQPPIEQPTTQPPYAYSKGEESPLVYPIPITNPTEESPASLPLNSNEFAESPDKSSVDSHSPNPEVTGSVVNQGSVDGVADEPPPLEGASESQSSWLDSITQFASSLFSPSLQPANPIEPEAFGSSNSEQTTEPAYKGVEEEPADYHRDLTNSEGFQESLLSFQMEDLFSGLAIDSLVTRIIAAAVTILLCIIAYFFIEKRRMDGNLVARINSLERELMVLSKENALLKEESQSKIGEGQLEQLFEELREARAARAELEEQVAVLERDLDEAAEANMELNAMLEQTLETSRGPAADDVLASVEQLQAQLDGQKDTIGNMTRSLANKNAEIEALKSQLAECREAMSGLEGEVATLNENISNLRREKENEAISHVEKLEEVQNELAEALANKVLEESRLGSELSSVKLSLKKAKHSVVTKEAEVEALKCSLRELKSEGLSDEKLSKLFDAVKLHAQVEQLTKERDELEESLQGESNARKRLEDHVRVIESEVEKLRVNYEEAVKQQTEAQTRLEVLSNYFKEKEAQLTKELDLQELLVAQQRGDENSVLRQVQSLQDEVESYRSQYESLKQEILDQERDLKGQVAAFEKKAHDNWVAARQAERKLEESRQEASQLRNRLTLVEKNLNSSSDGPGGLEANGEGGVISPVMGLPGMGPMAALMGPMGPMIPPPPPPIDLDAPPGLPFMFPPLSPGALPPPSHPHFIPPLPPPPLMAGDRRPPPLGRMSSPPPAPPPPPGHFSPPPPHFDRLDRTSQSPSPTYHRSPASGDRHGFRPFAKPSPRKPTDYRGSNVSSGQSSESMEKTRTNQQHNV